LDRIRYWRTGREGEYPGCKEAAQALVLLYKSHKLSSEDKQAILALKNTITDQHYDKVDTVSVGGGSYIHYHHDVGGIGVNFSP
jgi:hypothetical protein